MIELTYGDAPPRQEEFVKSSFSGQDGAGCMHIARRDGYVLLWEDGDPFEAPYFTKVPSNSISNFLKGAKAGEFDDLIEA
jgi:hypothetical protein